MKLPLFIQNIFNKNFPKCIFCGSYLLKIKNKYYVKNSKEPMYKYVNEKCMKYHNAYCGTICYYHNMNWFIRAYVDSDEFTVVNTTAISIEGRTTKYEQLQSAMFSCVNIFTYEVNKSTPYPASSKEFFALIEKGRKMSKFK